MWTLILLGCFTVAALLNLWDRVKMRQEVRTLSWRLDGIWNKSTLWHNKVDKITGEVRRMTGDDWSVQDVNNSEEYDDVDRDADTQPRMLTKESRNRK